MAGWQSTVPAAIAALYATLKDSAAAGVTVSDGPAVVDQATSRLVTVGHQPSSSDDLAATVQTGSEGFGGAPQRETYDVYCSASAFTGDNDQSKSRAAAFDLYAAACAAVLADPTLGGAVMRAIPGGFSVHQSATTRGRATTVQFAVSIDAYTT